MISTRVVVDPGGPGALCVPCGAYWPDTNRAALCHPTPIVPGVSMRHARPDYVDQSSTYVPFTPHTYGPDRTRVYRALVVVGAFLVLAAIIGGFTLAHAAPRARFVPPATSTPTTYGPPASTGGPVITR